MAGCHRLARTNFRCKRNPSINAVIIVLMLVTRTWVSTGRSSPFFLVDSGSLILTNPIPVATGYLK